MQLPKRITGQVTTGDAAVEGLIYGLAAGLGMALFLVAFEWTAGVMPLRVLTFFGVSEDVSPWAGLFTHVAVSGIYGIVFGVLALGVARLFPGRMNRGLWLGLGILYGLVIFAVAKGVILPRTASPLDELPVWVLAVSHALYGSILAWFMGRNS